MSSFILEYDGTDHWLSPNTGATYSSGFTSLPGGYQTNGGDTIAGLYIGSYFWTSTAWPQPGGGYNWLWGQGYEGQASDHIWFMPDNFNSVRCIKD